MHKRIKLNSWQVRRREDIDYFREGKKKLEIIYINKCENMGTVGQTLINICYYGLSRNLILNEFMMEERRILWKS